MFKVPIHFSVLIILLKAAIVVRNRNNNMNTVFKPRSSGFVVFQVAWYIQEFLVLNLNNVKSFTRTG
jgi:hypothetical protein